MGLVKTHSQLGPLYHIQGRLVHWVCEVRFKRECLNFVHAIIAILKKYNIIQDLRQSSTEWVTVCVLQQSAIIKNPVYKQPMM